NRLYPRGTRDLPRRRERATMRGATRARVHGSIDERRRRGVTCHRHIFPGSPMSRATLPAFAACLLAAAFATSPAAALYKWTDASGRTVYSSRQAANAGSVARDMGD